MVSIGPVSTALGRDAEMRSDLVPQRPVPLMGPLLRKEGMTPVYLPRMGEGGEPHGEGPFGRKQQVDHSSRATVW